MVADAIDGRRAESSVEIDAPPERVWQALTEAAELERWFPLEARVEPGEGGSVWMSWKNEFAGEARILVWDPPRHLRVTWGSVDAESTGADAASGGGQVTDYLLESRGGRTFLRVVTSGFPPDATWDDWVEGTRLGWAFELRSLKHYLERHAGKDRQVVYLRRRVGLDRQEAWERIFGPGGLPDGPLGGRPVHEEPPKQYAALVEDPPGAMLRISTEPSGPGAKARDITFWLASWNGEGDAARLEALRRDWSRLLERLFPAGQPLPPLEPARNSG